MHLLESVKVTNELLSLFYRNGDVEASPLITDLRYSWGVLAPRLHRPKYIFTLRLVLTNNYYFKVPTRVVYLDIGSSFIKRLVSDKSTVHGGSAHFSNDRVPAVKLPNTILGLSIWGTYIFSLPIGYFIWLNMNSGLMTYQVRIRESIIQLQQNGVTLFKGNDGRTLTQENTHPWEGILRLVFVPKSVISMIVKRQPNLDSLKNHGVHSMNSYNIFVYNRRLYKDIRLSIRP